MQGPWHGLGVYPLSDGLALYQAHTGRLHLLNPTGALLWRLLADGATYAGATMKLARRFGVPVAQVRRDAAPLHARLESEGLLGPAAATPPRERPAPRPAPGSVRAGAGRRRRFVLAGRGFELEMSERHWRHARPVLAHLAASDAVIEARFEVRGVAGTLHLHRDGRAIARFRGAAGLQHALLRALNGFVFESPRFLTALHAGAVLFRGRCLVLPAAGGRGKTTLVAGLMARHATVLADDLLALEAGRLRVVGVPLPLRIKQGSWDIVEGLFPRRLDSTVHVLGAKRVRLLAPARGGRAWRVAHRVDALVSPEFRPGAAARIERCTPSEMLRILFGGSSALLGRPDVASVGAMVAWLARVPGYRIIYGSLADAIGLLEDLAAS